MSPAVLALWPAVILLTPCLSTDRALHGKVEQVGKKDEPLPAVGIDVRVLESEDTATTRDGGLFNVFLPRKFRPGEKITLAVEKKGWVIQYPLEGELFVPADPEKQVIQVKLLEAGSIKLWSEDHIEKFVEKAIQTGLAQVRPGGRPQDLDLSRYLNEWAARYGFTAAQVKAEVDKWVAETERSEKDLYKLGLVAYSKKDFPRAAELFELSGADRATQSDRALKDFEELRRDAAAAFRFAGDTRFTNYDFDKAMEDYEQALRHTWKDDLPGDWAALLNRIGKTHFQQGIRAAGEQGDRELVSAVAAHHRALQVFTREERLLDWARTQVHLGRALMAQGVRTDGAEGVALLEESVATHRRAVEVFKPVKQPEEWAEAQYALGEALRELGIQAARADALELLEEAAASHGRALEVYTREKHPWEWTAAQCARGDALREAGLRAAGDRVLPLLQEATVAYRQALEGYAGERYRQDWASVQERLGEVLREQGLRELGQEGPKRMGEAVKAYQVALAVYEREGATRRWALTQHAMGLTLEVKGVRIGGQDGLRLLVEATVAQRHAVAALRAGTLTPEVMELNPALEREPQIIARSLLLEAALYLVSGQAEYIPSKLQMLRSLLAEQPFGQFKLEVADVRDFVERDELLAPFRAELLELLAIADSGDRDAMIAAIDELKARIGPLRFGSAHRN